jgi:HD-GYP domain-containing protein (c-di-GMP phosphodiesterase class II)
MKPTLLKLKSFQLKIGDVLGCDLFVKISETKAILLLKKGTLIAKEDLEIYAKYEKNYVYLREEDFLSVFHCDAQAFAESLDKDGTIDIKATERLSTSFFKSEEIIESDDKLKSMVNMANNLIQKLISSSKNSRSLMINQILQEMSSEEDNHYVTHANQVTAISTMIALMIENVTLDNILEIAMGASMHAIGLASMVNENDSKLFATFADTTTFDMSGGKTEISAFKVIIDKHFEGHRKLTSSESVIYLKHLSFIEINVDKVKNKNIKPQQLLRVVKDFKYIQSSLQTAPAKLENPYISSKILAIGDRLVSLMYFYNKSPTMIENAIRDLTELNNTATPAFDPKIIEKLKQIVA